MLLKVVKKEKRKKVFKLKHPVFVVIAETVLVF
jgi:hypothetical protein